MTSKWLLTPTQNQTGYANLSKDPKHLLPQKVIKELKLVAKYKNYQEKEKRGLE